MKCRICGEEKEASEFYTRGALNKLDDRCGKCVSASLKARRADLIARGVCSYCGGPKDNEHAWCIECRSKQKVRRRSLKARDPEIYNCKRREERQKIKRRVFDAYGGCKCACCGETHTEFLSMDHINNDRAEHREALTGSRNNGSTLYGWLIKNNFPAGFRVLCFNCNFALGHFGYCPHGNLKTALQEVAQAAPQGDPCPATA